MFVCIKERISLFKEERKNLSLYENIEWILLLFVSSLFCVFSRGKERKSVNCVVYFSCDRNRDILLQYQNVVEIKCRKT